MNTETIFCSLHNHTIFCDGRDDIETMCRAAFEKKLRSVGFSSHAPINKKTGIKTGWHMSDDKLDEYISEVQAAKKRWKGKIDVFLGLEVDYIKGLVSPNDSDFKALNLDYIIGSVHYLAPENGTELFTVDGPKEEFEKGLNEGFNGDTEAFMQSYYNAVLEMIKKGGFDILGHADLIKKNYTWPQPIQDEKQKEIARAAGQTGLIVEVNTGGLNRNKINELYPSEAFLHHFNKENARVIITADAHRAEHINGNYETAKNKLISAGFKNHFVFLENKFVKTSLFNEKTG